MIDFSGYNATMRRGDSETISVSATSGTLFESGDNIYFTVRDEVDGDILVQKIVPYADLVEGKAIFTLDPADTQDLDAGRYVWDVEMKKSGGGCFHIIPPLATDPIPKFILKGDVTE